MDQFWEEAVVKRHQGLQNALYILATALAAALLAFALMLLGALANVYADEGLGTGFFLALGEIVLSGGVGALLFYFRDRIKTEYEYAFTAGLLDFAQVFNNKKRKALGTMTLRNVGACGLIPSRSFEGYLQSPGVKVSNWFLNRDAQLLYFYFQKDEQKRLIIIEPSDQLLELIQSSLAQGAWQNN